MTCCQLLFSHKYIPKKKDAPKKKNKKKHKNNTSNTILIERMARKYYSMYVYIVYTYFCTSILISYFSTSQFTVYHRLAEWLLNGRVSNTELIKCGRVEEIVFKRLATITHLYKSEINISLYLPHTYICSYICGSIYIWQWFVILVAYRSSTGGDH